MWSGSTPFSCKIGSTASSIGVDHAGQFFLAQVTQDDLVNETSFSGPFVIRLRVRQRRHKLEVLELRCDGRKLLEIEEIGTCAGSIKKPHRSLLFARDM